MAKTEYTREWYRQINAMIDAHITMVRRGWQLWANVTFGERWKQEWKARKKSC